MSVYSGQVNGGLIGLSLNRREYLSDALLVADVTTYTPRAFSVPPGVMGASNNIFPVSMSTNYLAYIGQSVNSPFYDHYFLVRNTKIYPSVNLGAQAPDAFLTTSLWNGYNREDTVASITLSQPEAIAITDVVVGTVFHRYQERDITFTVLSTSPPVINCLVTITMESGTVVFFPVLGVVATELPVRPQVPMVEFISFLTDVISSKDGTEQRRALRQYPRISLSAKYVIPAGVGANKFKTVLLGKSSAPLGTALWYMANPATTQPALEATEIEVDTTTALFREHHHCLVYDKISGEFEIQEITGVTSTALTFNNPLVNTYTQALVIPYFFMQIASPASWKDTQTYTSADLSTRMTDPVDVDPYIFATQYKSRGVLPYSCRLFSGLSETVKVFGEYDEMDTSTGTISKKDRWKSAKKTLQYTVHATTREECYDLRRIIHAMQGRQKAIWIPSFDNDFLLSADVKSNTIYSYTDNFSKLLFDDNTYYGHVAVFSEGNDPEFTEIESVSDDGSIQTVTVLDALTPADAATTKACFLLLCRLNSDTLELNWISPEECYCSLEFLVVGE